MESFFQVKQGLKQKDGLAPLLLSLVLDYVIRKLQVGTRHTLEYTSVQIVGYNNNNNVRSSIRNIGCLQIFSSLLGSWR
jgi:hypothetical protein